MIQGTADALEPTTLPEFGSDVPVLRAGQTFQAAALWTALTNDAARVPLALVDGKVPTDYYQNMMSYVHLGDPTAPTPRRGFPLSESVALAPVGEPSASIPQFSDAGWVAFDDVSGQALPQGPADVVVADYTYDATHPVIVDWVGGGLTVLGGAEGSYVTAFQTIRYGIIRDKRFLGRARIENQRADLHFVPGSGTSWPLASEVILTTPDQTTHTLRNDGTGDYATGFSGIDVFPASQIESFSGFTTGSKAPPIELATGRVRLGTLQELSIVASLPIWASDGQVAIVKGAIGVNTRFFLQPTGTTHALGLRLGVVPRDGTDAGRTLRVKLAVSHTGGAVDILRWPLTVGVMTQIGIGTVDGIERLDIDFEAGNDATNGVIIDDVRWN